MPKQTRRFIPKYQKWQQVRNPVTHPGAVGIIIEIDPERSCPYRVQFPDRPAIWHPENELRPA